MKKLNEHSINIFITLSLPEFFKNAFAQILYYSPLPHLLPSILRRLQHFKFFKSRQFIFLTAWERQHLKKFILVLLFHYFILKYGLWFMVIGLKGLLHKSFFLLPGNKTYLFWCEISVLQYQLLRIFLQTTLVVFQS